MSDLPPPPPPPPPPGSYGGATPAGGYGGAPAPAEIGPRLIAWLVDWFGIPLVLYIVTFIGAAVLGAVAEGLGGLFFLLGILAILAYTYGYIPYSEGTSGQTIGKKMQNVKLVGLENGGQPVGFGMAFVRNFVNGICMIGWLFPFFDAQKQTLGDKVSKSTVVPA